MAREEGRRLVPLWGVVVTAQPRRDASTGEELVRVTITSTPASTPPGLSLGDALDRLQPALAPGEAIALHVEDIDLLVGHPDAWPVLLGLPPCVRVVHAFAHVFDRSDPDSDALWRLALRIAAEPGAGRDAPPEREW